MERCFEQGPIRPPSEATSLLLRVTRNCPWNKCVFCHTYRDAKFSLRSVEEVRKDIEAMRETADEIAATSWKLGEGGLISRDVLKEIGNQKFYSDFFQTVAVWLYFGGENVFLQDADSLVAKTSDLIAILDFLKEKFPQIKRITTYCRSHTAARKTIGELEQLRKAGLSRIHIGMESGSDDVLALINKGVKAADHIKAGQNVKQAGLELSEYFMPGLGGAKYSVTHALETARVMNAVNPDFIRLRTLHIVPGTELDDAVRDGKFLPLGDEEVLREIELFIENLEVKGSRLVSDHILNLLEELEGTLPEDKPKLLSAVKRYFDLSDQERLIFRLGRRSGAYRRLDDMEDKETFLRLKTVVQNYSAEGGNLEEDMGKIMNNYI